MAGKNTSKQWILFMFISALAILLMAIGILDKDWILFGLAFVSFVCNMILMREFKKKNKS